MSTPETPAPAQAPAPAPLLTPPSPSLAPTPAPAGKSLVSRLTAAVAWAFSPEGRKDLGAAIGIATGIYTALHRSGVL